jgi:hypothetical protein
MRKELLGSLMNFILTLVVMVAFLTEVSAWVSIEFALGYPALNILEKSFLFQEIAVESHLDVYQAGCQISMNR